MRDFLTYHFVEFVIWLLKFVSIADLLRILQFNTTVVQIPITNDLEVQIRVGMRIYKVFNVTTGVSNREELGIEEVNLDGVEHDH